MTTLGETKRFRKWAPQKEDIPHFLKVYYDNQKKTPTQKARVFDPFRYSFEKIKSHLVEKSESDYRTYTRIQKPEIIQFLAWWEKKYFLIDSDLEAIYAQNLVDDQIYPGKFWANSSRRTRNDLRLQWFKEHNDMIMPEYQLYLGLMRSARSSFIHRR